MKIYREEITGKDTNYIFKFLNYFLIARIYKEHKITKIIEIGKREYLELNKKIDYVSFYFYPEYIVFSNKTKEIEEVDLILGIHNSDFEIIISKFLDLNEEEIEKIDAFKDGPEEYKENKEKDLETAMMFLTNAVLNSNSKTREIEIGNFNTKVKR